MSLAFIKQCNPDVIFYTTKDEEFRQFGRILSYDSRDVIEQVSINYPVLRKKATYTLDCQDLHNTSMFPQLQHDIFGEMAIQMGIVSGFNTCLSGIEYHQGSEVNIACTDCLLVLGRKMDMQAETYDSRKTMNFYIEKGEVIELFSSTLHYTPMQVMEDGFAMVVILLKGTNSDIGSTKNQLLTKKNKWYITHASQVDKIKAGCLPGLIGPLLTIHHKK